MYSKYEVPKLAPTVLVTSTLLSTVHIGQTSPSATDAPTNLALIVVICPVSPPSQNQD